MCVYVVFTFQRVDREDQGLQSLNYLIETIIARVGVTVESVSVVLRHRRGHTNINSAVPSTEGQTSRASVGVGLGAAELGLGEPAELGRSGGEGSGGEGLVVDLVLRLDSIKYSDETASSGLVRRLPHSDYRPTISYSSCISVILSRQVFDVCRPSTR